MHIKGLINWLHDCLTDIKAVSRTDEGRFASKASIHPLNYTAGAWAFNLNVSAFRANWTVIILQKLIRLSKISNTNRRITGCCEWQQWGQHMLFSIAKCQHSQGCVSDDTSPQHTVGWSCTWLHLIQLRSEMDSLPRARTGREKVCGWTETYSFSEEQKSACHMLFLVTHVYVLGKHQKQISTGKD